MATASGAGRSKGGKGATGKEMGMSGLIFSQAGRVEEELLPQLAGRKAIETFRDMRDNDPVVGAILFTIDMLVRQVEWRVDPFDGEGGNDEDVEFLESCMNDMSQSWGDFISEVMSMLVFGFSFHEIVYKPRQGPEGDPGSRFNDGKVGWRKLPIRGQESLDRWEFDDQGGLKAMVQKPAPKFDDITIPIEKGVLFRTTTYKNNPEGRSVLRNAYRPWFYKKRIENIEGVGIERDLAGLPLLGVDPAILHKSATDDDKAILAAIENIGKNVRQDKQGYIIWPNAYDDQGNKMYTFELVSASGGKIYDTSAIIQRYDQRICMTTLSDFILLGHEKVGSFALASDKTDLFAVAISTYLDIIEDTMNRFAVPRLFEVNGGNLEALPEIKHGDIEAPNLAELGAYISSLVSAGVPMFPDEELEKYLRQVASLPEKSEEALAMQQQKQMHDEEMKQAALQQAQAAAAGGGGAVPPQDNKRTGNVPVRPTGRGAPSGSPARPAVGSQKPFVPQGAGRQGPTNGNGARGR
jgi:hypothetical protein